MIRRLACAAAFLTAYVYGNDIPATVEKPVCTARLAGTFWPAERAEDPSSFSAKSSPNGTPEVCSRFRKRYVWRVVTVSLDQLRAESDEKQHPPGLRSHSYTPSPPLR